MKMTLRNFLKTEGYSNNAFAKTIGTSHVTVGNWLKDEINPVVVDYDARTGKINRVHKETVIYVAPAEETAE